VAKLDQETWTRIFPWLDRAHDVPEAELDAWLEQLSAAQPEIGIPLRALLKESRDLETREFLSRPYEFVPEGSRAGQQVGSYAIDTLLGRGGMGEVWLARRSDGRFEGLYAVKLLWITSRAVAGERFRREGRLLARLTHPNIARLIDAGTMPDGQPYLVLEYVKGEHIDVHCNARALDLRERLVLFLKVLAAVSHAHTNLVVHRDIKPSNVMVTAEGDVKLLDFGIAKLVGGDQTEDEALPTRMDNVALTPEYAAPEQILGEPPSTATDVYQLGVLLYLLLVGRLPFTGAGTTRGSRARAALDEVPPLLSQLKSGHARNVLRGDLDSIVAKALRKRPDERYSTAAALAADLERYLHNEPVLAREGTVSYRAGKFLRRYRGAVLATAAALLALALTAGFALIQMHEARAQRNSAQFNEKRAQAEYEFMFQVIASVTADGQPLTPARILDEGVKMLDGRYANDPEFRVVMYLQLAARYGDPHDFEKSYALDQKAEAIALRLDDPYLISKVECLSIEPLNNLGRLDEARKHLVLGQASVARLTTVRIDAVSECMDASATLAASTGDMASAIAIMKQALDYLEKHGATKDDLYVDLLSHLGYYYHEMGDSKNTFEVTQRTVATFEENGQAETHPAIMAQHNLAMTLASFGEIRSAIAVETKTIAREVGETRDGQVNSTFSNGIGSMQLRLNQPRQALQSFDTALSQAQKSNDVQRQFNPYIGKARAHIALGQLDDASAELEQLEQHWGGQEAANGRAFAQSKVAAIELLAARGNLPEARRRSEALLPELRDAKDARHTAFGPALLTAAQIAIADRRFADAKQLSDEALTVFRPMARNVDASADVGEALLLSAQAQLGLGDADHAKTTAAAAVAALSSGLGADHPFTVSAAQLAGLKAD
jgi:tetratricopeptide (TPR) repeat protein